MTITQTYLVIAAAVILVIFVIWWTMYKQENIEGLSNFVAPTYEDPEFSQPIVHIDTPQVLGTVINVHSSDAKYKINKNSVRLNFDEPFENLAVQFKGSMKDLVVRLYDEDGQIILNGYREDTGLQIDGILHKNVFPSGVKSYLFNITSMNRRVVINVNAIDYLKNDIYAIELISSENIENALITKLKLTN